MARLVFKNLRSKNDIFPSEVLSKKVLKELNKLPLTKRNKILQENLKKIKTLKKQNGKKKKN